MMNDDYADPATVDAESIVLLYGWMMEGYKPSVDELPMSETYPFGGPMYPWNSEDAWQLVKGVDRLKFMEMMRSVFDSRTKSLELESKQVVEVIEFKELKDPFEATRIRIEAEIGAAINAWSRRQERAVVERIGGTKARKGTRHWEGQPGTKAIDAVYVVNPEQWADDLVQDIEPLMKAIGEKEALKASRELDRAGVLDRLEQDGKLSRGRTALDRMLDGSKFGRETFLNENLEPVKAMIRKSALRQSERIIEVITQMDADGASVEEIKREIQKMIGSRSSWKRGLAIAAATSIMEGSRAAVHERAGRYVKRIWRTMRDEKVRPSHRRAFGQKRSATNPFRVGTARLMYPGDPTGPIEETANCRCWVEVEIVSGR